MKLVDGDDVGALRARRSTRRRRRSTSSPSATPAATCPTSRRSPQLAHEHGIPLIVDNTFGAAGYLVPPDRARRRHRRRVGHEVDRRPRHLHRRRHRRLRQVRLGASGKFPVFTEPSPGLPRPRLQRRRSGRRARSATSSSSSAPASRGCATSGRRSRRSTRSCSCRGSRRSRCACSATCDNALALARWLKTHGSVAWYGCYTRARV